jgi:hypothetical protein
MAPLSFMFTALGATATSEVEETLAALNLGTLLKVDRAEIVEGQKAGMSKFFVHYSEFNSDKADKVRAELEDFKRRKEAGEVDVRPKRIVYDVARNGKERYWQIFLCDTPVQREQSSKKKFVVRVE